jgi:hypothetical protein
MTHTQYCTYTKTKIPIYMIIFLFVLFSPVDLKAFPQSQADLLQQQYGLSDDELKQVENTIYSVFPSPEEIQKNAIKDNLEIKISPKYPDAYEDVVITVTSNLTDLNRSKIFWYLDNELKKKGIGKTKFNFSTKNIGETSIIDIVIKTTEGYHLNKEIKIIPVGLDVFWETEGYTPPFYKGKALASQKSSVKLIAIPNFITHSGYHIPANKLVYIWRKNNKVVEDSSGYGKNIFYSEAPLTFGKNNIDVEISSLDNSLKIHKRIQIGAIKPKIIIYENKPTEGMWYENAIKDNFNLTKQEIAVVAEPYFFAKSAISSNALKYKWSMNNTTIDNKNKEVVFRQDGKKGTALIKVAIEDASKRLTGIWKSFVLNFKDAGLFNF